MRGYLFVEEEQLGVATNTFTERFFISFPFCGLKWFTREPDQYSNINNLLRMTGDTCGWVFGAGIIPHEVDITHSIKRKKKPTLYPFRIVLKSNDHLLTVKMASEDEDIRQDWVTEINLSIKRTNFIASSIVHDTLPYPTIFDALRERIDDSVTIRDIPLSKRVLSTVSMYYQLSFPHGSMLHSLVLENVQLKDSLVPMLGSIIEQSTFLGVLSLDDNFISSNGAKLLAASLQKCSYMTDFSICNNQVGNTCAEELSSALCKMAELRHINLSRNRFTERSSSVWIKNLANNRSKLLSIDFSHNSMGDQIAVFAALLMMNIPSHIQHIDVSFCGISEAGLREIANALKQCSTLNFLGVQGCGFEDTLSLQNLIKAVSWHHDSHQRTRSGQGMYLRIGGITQDCDRAECLSLKALKSSLMHVSGIANLSGIVMRRRLLYTASDREGDPVSTSITVAVAAAARGGGGRDALQRLNDTYRFAGNLDPTSTSLAIVADRGRRITTEEEAADLTAASQHPIICMRITLPGYLRSPQELLDELAGSLRCDPAQLLLLSCSWEPPEATKTSSGAAVGAAGATAGASGAGQPNARPLHAGGNTGHELSPKQYFMVFTVTEVLPSRLSVRKDNSYFYSLNRIVGSARDIVRHIIMNADLLKTSDRVERAVELSLDLYDEANVRPVVQVVQALRELAEQSHAVLRMFGVRTFYMKYPNPGYTAQQKTPCTGAAPGPDSMDIDHDTVGHQAAASVEPFLTCHVFIKQAAFGGSGLDGCYMPPLTPVDLSQLEGYGAPDDTDDDEYFEVGLRRAEHHINLGRGGGGGNGGLVTDAQTIVAFRPRRRTSDASSHEADHLGSLPGGQDPSTLAASAGGTAAGGGGGSGGVVDDDDDDDFLELGIRSRRSKYTTAHNPFAQTDGDGDDEDGEGGLGNGDFSNATEAHRQRITRKRQLRESNERLVQAVRLLYKERSISGLQAKFWEGSFGHIKHRDVPKLALRRALHPESKVFRAVHYRQLLFDAMFKRDVDKIGGIIEQMQQECAAAAAAGISIANAAATAGSSPLTAVAMAAGKATVWGASSGPTLNITTELAELGGQALVYAQRLRSEVLGLRRRFRDIEAMAQSFSELSMVEEYLLACGKLGYSGPEMFQAVDLRQKLVAKALKTASSGSQLSVLAMEAMPTIKHRALFSNLLISREMGALETKLYDLNHAMTDEFLFLPETIAAQTAVNDSNAVREQLHQAAKAKNIEALDQALAFAAYNYYFSDFVRGAVSALNEASKQPIELLRPVLDAMRKEELPSLDPLFEKIRKMGWRFPALNPALCRKIHSRSVKLLEDASVRNRLLKLCVAIKEGVSVNIGEMMQLLRRATALKLELDPTLAHSLKVNVNDIFYFSDGLQSLCQFLVF